MDQFQEMEPSGLPYPLASFLEETHRPWAPGAEIQPKSSNRRFNTAEGSQGAQTFTNKSSLMVHGSNFTEYDSLPCLTHSESATTESADTDVGCSVLDTTNRNLQSDGSVQHPGPRMPLECPFICLGCVRQFQNGDTHGWVQHSLSHFTNQGGQVEPPKVNPCCFCTARSSADDGYQSWRSRMAHVKLHHDNGHRLAHARLDFEFVHFLWVNGIIDQMTYRELLGLKYEHADANAEAPVASQGYAEPSEPVAQVHERRRRQRN